MAYYIRGDIARLRVAPAQAPVRRDELWRTTCFEAFVMTEGDSRYREFNFAPSGAWAAYAFSRYRQGLSPGIGDLFPGIAVRYSAREMELQAFVSTEFLCPD